jgi:hypothetical protein
LPSAEKAYLEQLEVVCTIEAMQRLAYPNPSAEQRES